jgi:MerR family transcriptional regulator, redox-sensitive transcriptional activator SoxR
MSVSPDPMSIGQVAARAGVRASRIRYYEDVGVLSAPERNSGQRRYGEDVLHRLAIIDVAQRAGLSLEEIRDLTHPQNGHAAGDGLRALADRRLPDIEALIERAQAVKRWLEIARSCECDTVDVCALFVDPAMQPPPSDIELSIHKVGTPIR